MPRTSEQYLSREELIDMLTEAGLGSVLGASIAYIPDGGVPEGQKMRIESAITGIPSVFLDFEDAPYNPKYGYFDITKDWGYTSRIDFLTSDIADKIAEGDRLSLNPFSDLSAGEYDPVTGEVGDPDHPELYYEIEDKDGTIFYVIGEALSDLQWSTANDFENIIATIYLPCLSCVLTPMSTPYMGTAPGGTPPAFEEVTGPVGPPGPDTEPPITAPGSSIIPGETAISWNQYLDFVGEDGNVSQFSNESFVGYNQITEIINWFDTIAGDAATAANDWLVNRRHGTEYAVEMELPTSGAGVGEEWAWKNIDENLILNYMSFSRVPPEGTYGTDRTNPKSTSWFDASGYALSETAFSGKATVPLSTGANARTGLESRYKTEGATMAYADAWVVSKALEIEATKYASITTKLFAVKLQRAAPIDNIMAIGGPSTTLAADSLSAIEANVATTSPTIPTSSPTTSATTGPGGYGGY